MRKWNCECRTRLVIGAVFLFLVSTSSASPTDKTVDFRNKCGVDPGAAVQLFADASGKGWKKYYEAKDFPSPDSEWAENASVWGGPGAPLVAAVYGEGEDFSDGTYYCFASTGELLNVEHEFRTAWGWGFWESESFVKGLAASRKGHFFDTKTQAIIPRPSGAADVRDAMRLVLYKTLNNLPFFDLMEKNGGPTSN